MKLDNYGKNIAKLAFWFLSIFEAVLFGLALAEGKDLSIIFSFIILSVIVTLMFGYAYLTESK